MFKNITFFCLLALLSFFKFSFSLAIDPDTSKLAFIDTLLKKADSYQRAMPDSAIPLYQKAYKISNELLRNMENKNVKDQIIDKIAYALSGEGTEYFNKGNYTQALGKFLESIHLYQQVKNDERIAVVHICLGRTYRCNGPEMFTKAQDEFFQAQLVFAETNNAKGLASAYREIGWLLCDEINQETYNLDSSLAYFNKSWEIIRNTNFTLEIAKTNNGLAWVLSKLGRFMEALPKAEAVMKFYEETQNTTGLYNIYYTLGNLHLQMDNQQNALLFLNKSLKLTRQVGNTDMENNILEVISDIYLKQKNYKKAYEYFHQSVDKKFEMFSSERINAIEEMKTKYETEKKEIEIQSLSKQKNLQSKLIVLLSLGIMLTFAVISVGWMFYRAKRKANDLLSLQNAEIIQQKEEITTQMDEIETQRDLVTRQKHQIELIHNELTSNIAYARQIQNTLLPDLNKFSAFFKEYFVFFKPRDGVSGDFYWMQSQHPYLAFCVADCTGHGVTGSLMSMLGISFLNEIFQSKNNHSAANILDSLRKKIIDALQQKGIRGEHKDGLDIALCILNTETLELQFSGAMNPCWIIKAQLNKNSTGLHSPELLELQPNLMPVAIHHEMAPFNQQFVKLETGDTIYLFSDGYSDQPGGEKNKKIQSGRLRELLIKNCQLPLTEQKNIIESFFNNWKSDNSQMDDVTVLGIKI